MGKSFVLIVAAMALLAACSDPTEGKPKAVVEDGVAPPAADVGKDEAVKEKGAAELVFELNAQNTKVGFLGTKVVGSHEGVFGDVSGELTIVEGDLSLTKLSVRVKTASVKTDSQKLDEHLRSGDFFQADKHPTASFELLEVKEGEGEGTYQLKGELTIRGASKTVSFPAEVGLADKRFEMKTEFVIDRKDFGIVYPGMPDNLINDEVLLKISAAASAR